MPETKDLAGHTSLCQCGSYDDAYVVAERLVRDAIQHQCPAWALVVSVHFARLSARAFQIAADSDAATVLEATVLASSTAMQDRVDASLQRIATELRAGHGHH